MISRRNTKVVSVLKFLNKPSEHKELIKNGHQLPYLSKKELLKFIEDTFKRLFENENLGCQELQALSSASSHSCLSLLDSEALEKLLKETEKQTPKKHSEFDFKTEIKIFEGTRKKQKIWSVCTKLY